MLATRMFFWWGTAFVDPMTPVETVSASARVFEVPAQSRRFEVPAQSRRFEVDYES